MKYDFNAFDLKKKEVNDWLAQEYIQLQTGRISAAVVDNIKIDIYGTKTPIVHLASVSVEDPKTLLISPYDNSTSQQIESTLREKLDSFGISVSDSGIRVIAPTLTSERRTLLEKIAKEKRDEAKNSLRSTREKVINVIKKQTADKILSEDESFSVKKEFQEIIDKTNESIDVIFEKKIKDIKS